MPGKTFKVLFGYGKAVALKSDPCGLYFFFLNSLKSSQIQLSSMSKKVMLHKAKGEKRVIVKNIMPATPHAEFPSKSSVGEPIHFKAVIIADGHDKIFARVLIKSKEQKGWTEIAMKESGNDQWQAAFIPELTGKLEFKIEAWISDIKSWQDSYEKKQAANTISWLDQQKGIEILEHSLKHCPNKLQQRIEKLLADKKENGIAPEDIDDDIYTALLRSVSKEKISTSDIAVINIERERARFSTWYELFPRSCATEAGKHGTFIDVVRKLPSLKEAGFDVLYLPPIHPIGKVNRKGRNNSLVALPADPGSPWAIGSDEGGHKAIHPELGNINDFRKLIREARKNDIEIAMDIALQCAPDHPYVKEHPEWFKWRADGTVQFAENPPKKYEDILPFDFDSEAWESLWSEVLSIFSFWIETGITIFRVDNPHTKSLRMWEWLIESVKKEHPDVIFLAEAFTRPNIMEHLAMAGFTQSYTYFTWRNSKKELQEYLMELTGTSMQYYFRPNFWPNTPDILPEHLVTGGENMHIIRLLLAATLSSNYGLYGPVYERCIHQPMPGKEEYIDNEKYEIKYWSPVAETRIWKTIKAVNKIRKDFFALQITNNVRFLDTSNDQIMAFIKLDEINNNNLLVIINLDCHNRQSAWINIPAEIGKTLSGLPLHLSDQLNDEAYTWKEDWNYAELDPYHKPAHIFLINNKVSQP